MILNSDITFYRTRLFISMLSPTYFDFPFMYCLNHFLQVIPYVPYPVDSCSR